MVLIEEEWLQCVAGDPGKEVVAPGEGEVEVGEEQGGNASDKILYVAQLFFLF